MMTAIQKDRGLEESRVKKHNDQSPNYHSLFRRDSMYSFGYRLRWWLKSPVRAYAKWKKKDRRAKGMKGWSLYAVNRDGDLYLVTCPRCGSQFLDHHKNYKAFHCWWRSCSLWFAVYREDGVVAIRDHRKGELPLPATLVRDPYSKVWRAGMADESPWWWTRRPVYLDLQESGKDAHGHDYYREVEDQREKAAEKARSIRAAANTTPK